ncbi:MAG: TRAP transporter substrate-binding protein DctP [Candidatus Eisenbacteria bacterium]|uniref:TRAP transporter substrate-binding protein DctP n=1 Tax=Eiseniibacteriota bacterium TaxID=2212470 RepID=A0A849SN78_UNCEI|nr:TRAP transporter substrate-binding protein DctP [Candidatus Eisenbacteria bacterium]
MIRTFARFGGALSFLVLALALPPSSTAQSQGTVIKLATLVPDGSIWDLGLKQMGAEWSQGTQGRVSLRIYPGGVAGDEGDVVRKMRIGQIHAASLTVGGLSEIDPAFKLFTIPMFFASYPELRAVIDKLTPMLKQRLEAKGFVLTNWGHGGWVYVFSKHPVSSVADLRKTKLWVGTDAEMAGLWKSKGYSPVSISATDIMTGIQSGMLEAIYITPVVAVALQWFRQTPNMCEQGLAPLVGATVISKAAWNKLSEADRKVVQAAGLKLEAKLEREVPRQDTLSVAVMRSRGLRVVPVSAAQAKEWRTEAEEFAQEMRGALVPAEVMDLARRERDAYRARSGK